MATLSLISLYVNVFTKALVSVNGSPTTIPDQYYGDTPTFQFFPVVPNPNGQAGSFVSFDLTGYTSNITMADTPNATSPPTPFADTDGLTWMKPPSGLPFFVGAIDLTQPAVGTFIGALPLKTANINFDVYDPSLFRTTLLQTTFQMKASIDTVTASPPVNVPNYPTLAQLKNMFVQIAAFPGKFILWESPNGLVKKVETLNNDGSNGMSPD